MEKMEKVYRVLYKRFLHGKPFMTAVGSVRIENIGNRLRKEKLGCKDSVRPILILSVFVFNFIAILYFSLQTSSVSFGILSSVSMPNKN